jgi:hypothetical protein
MCELGVKVAMCRAATVTTTPCSAPIASRDDVAAIERGPPPPMEASLSYIVATAESLRLARSFNFHAPRPGRVIGLRGNVLL